MLSQHRNIAFLYRNVRFLTEFPLCSLQNIAKLSINFLQRLRDNLRTFVQLFISQQHAKCQGAPVLQYIIAALAPTGPCLSVFRV